MSSECHTTLAGIEGKNTLIRFPSLPTKFTTPPRFRCAASEGLTMIVCFDNACAGLQAAVRRGGLANAVMRIRGGVGGVTRMGGSMRGSAQSRRGSGRRIVGVDA